VVAAAMVVCQPEEGDPDPYYQGDQQNNQANHQGCVQVLE
jgi:hypothetical protein